MAESLKVPPPPKGLGRRGRAFWKELQGELEFDAAATQTLVEACRTLDRLEELDAVIAAEGVTSTGSMGQTVVHPAVAEARQMQAGWSRLVTALDLPASEEEERDFEAWKTRRAKAGAAARHGYLKAVP